MASDMGAPAEPPMGSPSPVGQAVLAGRWRRLFAGVIDAIIVGIVTSPLSSRAVVYHENGGLKEVHVQHIFLSGVIGFLYYFLLQAFWNGQTLGKKLFRMRVVQETG